MSIKLPDGVPAMGIADTMQYARKIHQDGDCRLCGVPCIAVDIYCVSCQKMITSTA